MTGMKELSGWGGTCVCVCVCVCVCLCVWGREQMSSGSSAFDAHHYTLDYTLDYRV